MKKASLLGRGLLGLWRLSGLWLDELEQSQDFGEDAGDPEAEPHTNEPTPEGETVRRGGADYPPKEEGSKLDAFEESHYEQYRSPEVAPVQEYRGGGVESDRH